jgi:acetyltransferase-like isoleucine patch superfamily enzyme
MRQLIKFILNKLSQLLSLPFAATCWLESQLSKESEVIFIFWSNLFALVPGLPGAFLRRGYYSLTLDKCSMNCHIGFGSMFTHRSAKVEDNVYLGNYCTIGSALLGENSLIGSRSSLLSGSQQHKHNDETGEWEAFSPDNIRQITVGANVWIGEGAIIMANIGEGCQIAAGAVITNDTKSFIVLAGNPARFIKNLAPPTSTALPITTNNKETPLKTEPESAKQS